MVRLEMGAEMFEELEAAAKMAKLTAAEFCAQVVSNELATRRLCRLPPAVRNGPRVTGSEADRATEARIKQALAVSQRAAYIFGGGARAAGAADAVPPRLDDLSVLDNLE